MPHADQVLGNATLDHVALSVGDLDAMVAFYGALGFREVSRADFTPAPLRLVTVANAAGARIELTAHAHSVPPSQDGASSPVLDPISAATKRGVFHIALATTDVDRALEAALAAGARRVTPAASTSTGDRRFAYVVDPEGTLIELVSQ